MKPEGQSGEWKTQNPDDLKISRDNAITIATMAVEMDGKRLLRLWSRAGIVSPGPKAATRRNMVLDPEVWAKLGYDYVIVLWADAADKMWEVQTPAYTNCLCCCTPFGVWASCEHEQVTRAHYDETFKITSPGQTRGGRGLTNAVFYSHRSMTARLHHRIDAGLKAKAKDAQNAAAQERNPAKWRYAAGSSACNHPSNVHTTPDASVRKAKKRDYASISSSSESDESVRNAKRRDSSSTSSGNHISEPAKSELHALLEQVGAKQWVTVLEEAGGHL